MVVAGSPLSTGGGVCVEEATSGSWELDSGWLFIVSCSPSDAGDEGCADVFWGATVFPGVVSAWGTVVVSMESTMTMGSPSDHAGSELSSMSNARAMLITCFNRLIDIPSHVFRLIFKLNIS